MLEQGQALLGWVAQHPGWALALLFLVSFIDAVFIIGAFVPASIVLFAVGALVAVEALELWPTALVAAAGALSGDLLSYWLGRRYGEALFEHRWLRRYPELISSGRSFFQRHGGKGVWLARFLGPVRAVTPALAGAAGMPALLFLLVDLSAAYVWALLYIVPGVVFGASLGLAAEVATRLVLLLVLALAAAGLAIWLTRFSVAHLQVRSERWMGAWLDWSRRHRGLGRFGAALADPDQPETPVLLLAALALTLLGALLLFAWAGTPWHPYPQPVDALIHQWLRDLQTPWGLAVAAAIASLGHWTVYAPVALTVMLALLFRRKPRAAAHWAAAVGFGLVISLLLQLIPILPPPAVYFGQREAVTFGDRDLVMVTVIYGFIPVLQATLRPSHVRGLWYMGGLALLLLIALARVVLAAEWASLALLSLAIGAAWVGLLALGYRRHRPERIFGRGFVWPVSAVFLLAAVASGWTLPTTAPPPAPRTVSLADWLEGTAELPASRVDIRGRPGAPFDLQIAGALPALAAGWTAQGWQPVPAPGLSDSLRWLTASAPVTSLAVLPQVHAGEHPVLTLRYPLDAERQWLLRLWPAQARLADGRPLWVASLTAQRARTFYRLFRYPVAESQAWPADLPLLPAGADWLEGPPGPPRRLALPAS
ncbi:MAG TPA: DedA family protein [Nevskiaceae bacterium]|nr:DedA family protein [Nevskiaceae bacterium]